MKIKDYVALLGTMIVVALPAIIEMSLNTGLMVADTLMVSRLVGKEALSAVGVANSVMYTLIFVFTAFNTGAVAMISRSYGEKDLIKAKEVANLNLILNLGIGIAVTLVAYLLRNWLFMPYDITSEVRAQVYIYFDIVMFGMVFQFVSFAFASISRGVEDTKSPMMITLVANVVNVVFNYLLIEGVWIFPRLQVAGAAWATTLSRVVAVTLYIWLFYGGAHKLRLFFNEFKLKTTYLKSLWRIAFPGAIEQFMMQTAFLVAGIIITKLDTDSEAAFRILLNIESTSFMPAVGISIAAATMVGKSLGEKQIEKAYAIGKLAGILGVIWGALIGIVFIALPTEIVSLFTVEEPLIAVSAAVMFYIGINQPLLNYNIAMSGALRGAGDTKAVMRLTALRLWVMFVPLTYIAIVWLDMGVAGLWYAEIASFAVFSAVMYRRFASKKWAQIVL